MRKLCISTTYRPTGVAIGATEHNRAARVTQKSWTHLSWLVFGGRMRLGFQIRSSPTSSNLTSHRDLPPAGDARYGCMLRTDRALVRRWPRLPKRGRVCFGARSVAGTISALVVRLINENRNQRRDLKGQTYAPSSLAWCHLIRSRLHTRRTAHRHTAKRPTPAYPRQSRFRPCRLPTH